MQARGDMERAHDMERDDEERGDEERGDGERGDGERDDEEHGEELDGGGHDEVRGGHGGVSSQHEQKGCDKGPN